MTWSVLQSAGANFFGTSVTATFGGNAGSGNKIIAIVGSDWSDAPTSVKDAAGNAWTQLGSAASTTNGSIWLYALDVPAGDVGIHPALTALFPSSNGQSIIIQEVSGLLAGNTSAMLDGTPVTLTGTAATTGSPAYSSTASGEYLICGYADKDGSASLTPASGWTLDANSQLNFSDAAIEYENSTGGSESSGFGGAAAVGWTILTVAFKLPAAAAAPAGSAAARFAPGWHPGAGLPGVPAGTPFLAVLPSSPPPAVTATATASLAGAGAVAAVATVAAPATLAGGGTVSAVVTEAAGAAAAGSGSLSALVTEVAPAALSGAGAMTALVTVIVPAGITGAGVVSGLAVQSAPAGIAAAGAVSALVTERVIAAAAGAGLVTASVAGAGSTAAVAGAASLSAGAVQSAPASLAGAGALSVKAAVIVAAALPGAGSLSALAGQGSATALTGAGMVTAAGTAVAPFTSGILTAGDAPSATLTAGTAAQATLTTTTQATGGPS